MVKEVCLQDGAHNYDTYSTTCFHIRFDALRLLYKIDMLRELIKHKRLYLNATRFIIGKYRIHFKDALYV